MSGEEIKIKNPPLQEGQEICEECNGKGFFKVFINRHETSQLPCSACGGKGTIWWTEKATGINESPYFPEFVDSSSSIFGDSSSSISISVTSQSSPNKCFSSSGKPLLGIPYMEENLCHASQRSHKITKSIWHVINTQLQKIWISGVVRTLKSFKMVIT